ncbi:ABC transporter permease [Pseudolactococcus reticulitermitis]|uniref:ABC transporter permease n=1 Tax=Pseudolactococcus reticulitermitis TaxID=2025039 RepID=A0A224XD63_9LACT|nr:ABC-2 family transporter protein [Lactococcus reticulitermitis]GAX47553.1 hypothetical protein RsY01_1153 [Lactococcus reticulitermitis]
MFKPFRQYRPFIDAGIQQSITYRLNFVIFRLGDLLGAVVTYFLWRAIYNASSHATLNNFTFPEMSLYVFLSFYVGTFTSSNSSEVVGDEVKSGTIAMRLLKPISFSATYLYEEIGHKLVQIITISVPLLGGILLFQILNAQALPFNLINFILFFISNLLAYLLNFYFNLCFGFSSFVLKNLWGANFMKNSIINFMSGTLIPLSFFPDIVSRILQFSPFASMIYTPVTIYLGQYTLGVALELIALQLFWVLFFYGLSQLIWRVSIKHLTVQGG